MSLSNNTFCFCLRSTPDMCVYSRACVLACVTCVCIYVYMCVSERMRACLDMSSNQCVISLFTFGGCVCV